MKPGTRAEAKAKRGESPFAYQRDIDGLSPVAKAPLIPVQCSVILMIWMFILVTTIGGPRRQT
jgi:hypothetical protein